MRYLAIAILALGFTLGVLWPFASTQPAQYAVYTVSQPSCSASEAGDLTTFHGSPAGPFRAVCGRVSDGYVWQALPDPADVKPVCGPGSNAETVYCPNVTDWRFW